LQVLDYTVLADNVLNLALRLHVEGVLVEQGDLVLALALRLFGLSLPHGVRLSPAGRVVGSGGKLGVAHAQVVHLARIGQDQLSHTLWIRLRWPARLLHVPVRPRRSAHDHGQHLAIPYSGILESLCVDRYRLAVQVEAL
jgi:hypothetical protein